MDEDTTQAAWDQLEQEERRRREDAEIVRLTKVAEESKRESEEFRREWYAWMDRMRHYTTI